MARTNLTSIRMFLKCETRAQYDEKLEERARLWDPTFRSHFMTKLHPEMDRNGRWTATKIGWKGFTKLSNFTSNQCEHMNSVVRERTKYKEISMTEAFDFFRDMQRAYLREGAR
jgi:hypothetical protein